MTPVMKFLVRCLMRLLWRVEVRGLEHYRAAGERVLIIANHTSYLDGVLLWAWLPETPTFAINTEVATRPLFRPFLRFVDLFSMDPTNPLSVKSMIRFLRGQRKAVIFPEGRLTVTGIPMKVYEGPGLVADRADATVLPVAFDGTQYTTFSRLDRRFPRRWFPKIRMTILPPQRIELDPALHGHARRKAAGREMQRLLLRIFYGTYDYRRTLFAALLDAASRHGSRRPVLEDINREPLKFRQMLTRIMVLAPLVAKATSRGERVGVLLPNSSANALLFFAMQLTGRVPAMLNFTAGTQAILRACETASVRTVYTARRFVENAQLQDVMEELAKVLKVIYLEDLRAQVSASGRLRGLLASFMPALQYRLWGGGEPDDPAVVLFTSGSEGTPKGVVLSHANLLSNYAQVRCLIDFRPDDVMFSCLPMFHSFGLNGGLLMPLLGGVKVFLYPTPLHYRIIPELIYEMGATILFGTSTFFKGYARYAHPYDLYTLRYAVAGAERLRPETRTKWMEKFGIRILEGYGVTEASPVIAVNTPIANRAGSVGQLLPGVEYYLDPVPGIEEGGRLIVRGPNIMLGYLLPGTDGIRPPATDRGPGWYDTGDIAFVDAEGFLHIRGRARRFAKIGGEMVSLAAVEELALETWPNHNHAAVSISDERKGEKIILVSEYPEASRREIQEKARALRYSELYIPRRVVRAEKLPLLASGKTDYIALTKLLQQEDREDEGWVDRLGRLVAGEREDTLPAAPASGEEPPGGGH